MKSTDKLSWLANLQTKTEGHIRSVMMDFQNLDENTLNQSAIDSGWSIAQCLDHLNTYGNYYLPLLKSEIAKCAASNTSGVYTTSLLGTYLISVTDPQKSTIKLKAVKRHQPLGNLSAHQIVEDFIGQQEVLLNLLRKAEDIDVNRVRIPLSIASWVRLPLGDTLHFMVVHTSRHLLQANRNIGIYGKNSKEGNSRH